jgi:hypothetical protein
MLAEKEPSALTKIEPILRQQRGDILKCIASDDVPLRKTFAELEVLDYVRSYDECVRIVKSALEA